MSATDINLDVSYFKWPEVARLAGLLGRGTETLPLRLWAHCGEVHYEDGCLSDYTAAEVEAVVDWRGQAGKMVEAMVKVGFLRPLEGRQGFEVMHRGAETWLDRNGHIAAYRAKGVAMARAKQEKLRAEAAARGDCLPPGPGSSTVRNTGSHTDRSAERAAQLCQNQRTDGERRSGSGDRTLPAQRQRPTLRAPEKNVVVAGFRSHVETPAHGTTHIGALVTGFALREPTADEAARAKAERRMLARRLPFGDREGLRVQDLDAERCRWYLHEWEGRHALDGHLRGALELRVAQHEEERSK